MKIGRLLLRLTVGSFFFGHGTQKLFGWFGGHGLDATANMFDSIGMRPGDRNAVAAGLAEATGGAGIALGLATPLSASLLTSTMLTAINRVHLKNGPWAANGGYEYNVVLIAAVLALVEVGPGELSFDHLLRNERTGPGWTLAALALGVAGAVGAHIAAESHPAPVEAPEVPEAAPAPADASTNSDPSGHTETQEAGTAQ
jgi:putative oxidoreductase